MQTTALNNWVNLLKLIYKRAFFQVVVSVVRHTINPFNIKAVMLDHQCCIENARLRRLVWVFDARCKYQNIMELHVRIQVQTPPEKSQNIGFSSNTCPDPLKNRSCEASIQCWAFIGMPAKPLAGRWWPAESGTWILPPLINFKNKRCQSWIPSDKTFWIRAWIMSVDS